MYEDRYADDWDALDRDEAVERAYALGVAAELGEDNPDEYARLVDAIGRPLTQMAHDEGRKAAKELRHDLQRGAGEEARATAFPDRDHEIWSRLVDYGEGEASTLTGDDGPTTRAEVPELLRRFDLDGHPASEDGRARLRLPDFLFR